MPENSMNPKRHAPTPRWKHGPEKAQGNFYGILQVPQGIRLSRALGKTLKFRAVTLVTTLGITWLLTGNPVTSIGVTALQQGTNTAVYYFFEQNEKARHLGAGN